VELRRSSAKRAGWPFDAIATGKHLLYLHLK